jgi:hypothetical protein
MAEQALLLSAIRGIRSELSTGIPESGQKAVAIFREHQGKAPVSGDPMIDISGLTKHFGKCKIGIQDEWDVTLPGSAVREALGNVGKEGAKPVTAAGTYRSHDGKTTEASSEFTVGMPAGGLATITISVAPRTPKLTENLYGQDFAHIAPRTLEFKSVTPPGGVDAPAN